MTTTPRPYTPLFCKSNYSFLQGASSPDELIERAHELSLPAIALTDSDGVYGVGRAHLQAKSLGIQLIIGAEITLENHAPLLLLAKNRTGYASLCRLITLGRRRAPKGQCTLTLQETCEHADGLLALWGNTQAQHAPQTSSLGPLSEAFSDRLYALIVRRMQPEDDQKNRAILHAANTFNIPPVAATEVLYHTVDRRPLQDILTCIRHNVTIQTAGKRIRPNAEHALLAAHDFARVFADHPAAIENTLAITQRCKFSLDELHYRYPLENIPPGLTPMQWLRQLTLQGVHKRYGHTIPAAVLQQLESEFATIDDLNYAGYFLTMHEIVEFCRANQIMCQGRGSAANSALCYCLGITAVDPVKMGLLFERFLSRERAEPPDIDLDIAHNRREEVIQHVYQKYGRDHAAMIANAVRYRPRSAIRDVGKALGMPATTLDQLAKIAGYSNLDEHIWQAAGLDGTTPIHQHLERLTNQILDFPRHMSIHPGGFLLTHEPIAHFVPVENATMENRTVVQWDKYDVEALHLFKLDLLGLGALTMLDHCFRLLARHRNIHLSMATIPADDPDTYAMLRRADAVGVFQLESRAQMAMLPRLKPRCYYDLVIQISLVRPGPITGGMVHPYLARRAGEEEITYPHPSLEPVLKRTLGVPLFQEQVMRIAMLAADYTPGEADQLRRDMAAWKTTGNMERHHERLISRMTKKGIAPEFAERVFQQIKGFADYGFPESHAASFALISYATAYLRCHFPTEFTCALLNAQPMGFYSPATIVADARRNGVQIHPIDIQHSHWDCTLEPASPNHPHPLSLRMGFRYIKGLAPDTVPPILTARQQAPFTSTQDFITRTHTSPSATERLARSGALHSLEPNRRQALWNALDSTLILNNSPDTHPELALIDREARPAFQALTQLEAIHWDIKTSYHSTHGHPLGPLRPTLEANGLHNATHIQNLPDQTLVHYAGLVICRQRPQTASGVLFMTLEDEAGFVNLVVWPKIYEIYKTIARTASFLGVTGRIQRSTDNVIHLIVDQLWHPRLSPDQPPTPSRDFR